MINFLSCYTCNRGLALSARHTYTQDRERARWRLLDCVYAAVVLLFALVVVSVAACLVDIVRASLPSVRLSAFLCPSKLDSHVDWTSKDCNGMDDLPSVCFATIISHDDHQQESRYQWHLQQ
jgi:hypothetical protein